MKKILLFLCFAATAAAFSSCGSGSAQGSTTSSDTSTSKGIFKGTIKAGHLVALDMAPLFVAKEKGYFKDEGMDLQTVFFNAPGDNNAALAGGSIQFSTNPFTLPYFGENSGIPMRIIAGAGGLGIIEVVIQGNLNISDGTPTGGLDQGASR